MIYYHLVQTMDNWYCTSKQKNDDSKYINKENCPSGIVSKIESNPMVKNVFFFSVLFGIKLEPLSIIRPPKCHLEHLTKYFQ